jgi:hypothetical protein
MQFDRNLQIYNADGTVAAGVFTINSTLSAQVWLGQNQSTLFSPTVSWLTTTPTGGIQTGYDQGQVALSITGSDTVGLDPAGEYFLLISETTAGTAAPVWEGRLKILATPGSVSPSPPDLITYDYCESAMSELALSDTQRDFLPYLIGAASQAVRRYCFDRHFDLRTMTEQYPISQDGYVRLYQIPVNQVLRVQAAPQLVLTVTNNSSAVQVAQAYFAYTGQAGGYGANAQVATGLTFNWINSGVLTTQTLNFTTNQTIANLAAAINAVGSGWKATADPVLGLWPVTELDGGWVGQGCALSATPSDGALFNVLLDIANAQLAPNGQRSGMLWVGQQNSNSNAERWGPGGYELFGSQTYNPSMARAKITYAAGYTTIPPDVQHWTAQLVKWKFETMKQELLLKAEKAADYSYELSETMVAAMPATVRQGLSQWRLHYA